jgi:ABC-type nitrate/sulfonate/bicarbonate transport system permease component
MNNTTRRHPRTMAEAFPDERAGWFEVHRCPVSLGRQVAGALLAIAIGLALGVLAVYELAGG